MNIGDLVWVSALPESVGKLITVQEVRRMIRLGLAHEN